MKKLVDPSHLVNKSELDRICSGNLLYDLDGAIGTLAFACSANQTFINFDRR